MPVWGLAKKSVRVFLNFSFGQFFSQPLSDEQVVVTAKGVGCKDIYFNIKKINAILAERGIPLVLCVAYISELVISLPWSIELNGVDLVVQASPNGCRPTEDDALLNSMISSMTAAAFAAAKVTDGSNSWFRTHTHSFSSDEDDGSDNEDDENAITDEDSGKSSGLISRVQRFFERLTKTAEKANFDKNKSDSVVDQDSKERVVYMIDSLIAQTTVVLRNVSIRIECQLGLPGLNRASGITLCFQYLSLANQSSVSQNLGGIQRNDPDARSPKDVHGKFGSQTDVNYNTNSDGWSWMWPFGHARKQTSDTTTTTRTQTSTASGSLSTMLHKIIRLEGADVLWDLWDSTPKRDGSRTRRCGSRAMTTASGASASSSDGESSRGSIRDRRGPFTEFSEEADEEPEAPIPGPTEENVAASAKLLTLPGDEHTARVSMRCPLLALAARSTAGGDIEASARDCSTHATTTPGAPSSSSPDPWSAFELRVHLDIGPIVACVCPTQFYWLQLTVGQLNHIFQVYQDNVSTRASSMQPVGQCDMMPRPVNVIDPEETRWYPAAHQILPYEECVSNHQSECDLVDLDLSESGTKSRAFIDSKLFWSCVTDSPEDVFDGEGYYKQRSQCSNAAKHMTGQPEPSPIADPKFSLAANVLCCALVIFYEDEPVRNVDEPLASPSSTIAGSPPSDTAVFRRSMMHRSTMIESTRSIIEQSDSANEDDKVDCPVASEPDGSVTVEPKCGSLNTTVNTAAASCKLAALPGPFEFFARFHGLRPWRQPQPSESPTPPGPFKRSRSTATLSGATSYAQLTSPMRIDRYEVDTGQMTPSVWVAHLRRQFAELASPRDHLCFIGGLWHVEFCTRSLTAPATRGLTSRSDSIQGSSTEFGAQLFGFELSECLFPDPMVGEPKIYEVISFTDRLRGSSDRVSRGVSDQTAVKLSGIVRYTSSLGPSTRERHAPDHSSWPVAPSWNQLEYKNSTVLSGLIEVACCRIDVDLSLADRVHRITDAMAAASEAVSKLTLWSISDSIHSSPEWRGARRDDLRSDLCPGELNAPNVQSKSQHQPFSSLEPGLLPYSTDLRGSLLGINGRNESTNQTDLKLTCVGCEILLHFPVPLEAVKLKETQQLNDLRKTLWSTGTPLWFCPADLSPIEFDSRNPEKQTQPNTIGLAWWRRTLRPEHLRIGLDKLTLKYQIGLKPATDWVADNLAGQDSTSEAIGSEFGAQKSHAMEGNDKTGPLVGEEDSQVELSMRSVIVHWFHGRWKVQSAPLIHLSAANQMPTDLITVTLHLAAPGRTDLIEKPTDPHVKLHEFSPSEQVYTYSQQRQQRFEMGVDLANATNISTGTTAVEWSLWKRTGPKQNLRTPFVIRRNFLQDAPKMHSKQTTYYPGDSNHLEVFRQSASLHTRLHIKCTLPVFLVQVENKRTMELTYTRLMYDLLLWNSLLPSDRRLRATLARGNQSGSEATDTKRHNLDHCHWFLSDPAPLASIYAHPEAAREAAAREAVSSAGLGQSYGLHFHPVYSDDEDDEHQDSTTDMEGEETNDDVLFDFDPGLDAVLDGSRKSVQRNTRVRSPNQRARNPRSRNRARTPSDDSDDPGLVTEGATTVQRQSTCTVQLDVGNLEARFTLPGRHVPSTKPDLVRIVATDGTVFAELGHDGAPNVNFFTIELTKLEIFFSPCSGEGSVTNEGAGDCGSNWWPCLLWLSWSSIGYPLSQKLGIPSDSGAYSGAGPMFTLAVEHRQSQRSHPVSGIPVYRDDIVLAVRLQDSCLAHWPNLEPIPDAGTSSAGLPNWLTKLLLLFETPAIPVVKLLWPGYQLTDALFIQHVHLERSLFTWSSPEMDPGIPSMCYYMIPSLRSVRALIGCESISVTVNTASDALLTAMDNTVPVTGNIATGAGVATTTPSPGMLVMSFVSNAALFICPIPRTVPPGLEHLQSIMPGSATTNTPNGFLKWLTSLKITDCVCVADLDHMELRCFSDPMRNPASDANTPSFLTRTDVRFTNNLLRLHTCADSLAAMQILIQSLTPPDSRSVPSGQTKPHVDNDGPGVSGPKVESPAHLMTKGASRFGSHSSLHSNSPHQMDHRLSMDNQMASGSGSSVEDLLQGAISDAESLHSSPHKRDRFEPEFSSKGRQRDSPGSRHESHRPPESGPRKTQLLAEPTFSNLYPRWNSDDFPHADRPPSPDPQPSPPSSDSSPTEFVVIKPSMIPSRAINLVGLKDQIRCLVPFPSPGSSEAQTASDLVTGSRPPCGFEMRENYYPIPTGLSATAGTRSRMNRLFIDPPSVYPRATMALTLYNFSLEWNTYGGSDLIQSTSTGSVTDQLRNSSHSSQTPTPEHKHVARPNSGGSVSMTVGGPDGRLLSAKGGAEVGSGASKIAGLQPGVRFRHDRPVASLATHTISSPGSSATSGGNTTTMATTGTGATSHIPVCGADQPFVTISPQELYARGGRSRDASKCISLRLNKFYFRHSAFPECGHKNPNANEPSTSGRPPAGDPASRFVLSIGSLVILDRVASSRINQLLYTFNPSTSTGSVVPHSTDTPLLRAALVCWRVPTDTECASSPVPTDIRTVADTPNLELEAKISVQPLRINVDQNTLLFIEEFQQLFSSFSVTAADAVEPPTNATHATATQSTHPPQSYSTTSVDDTGRSVLTDNRVTTNPPASLTTSRGQEDNQSSHDETKKLTERPSIFIRKVTFYPDLPIRLDYHGRHLDFSAGSLQGFWRMLLQLNNGELVIPRRVYQRGYPNLERLLEEVMADLRVTIAAQLPQLICTGLGPMHEVRLFLLGLWDLVYQPVHSVYQGARDSSRVRDVQWPATEWDLSTCDLSAGSTGFDRRSSGGAGGFIQGLRRGTRSFSSSTLWATLQLSIQSVRVVQSIAETAYDLVTPGPALRSRQLRLRQPADLREGFGNAMNAMTRGFQMVTEDLCGATRLQSEVDFGYKGPVGMVGDVLRQIPPTIVAPVVAGCEVAANILGGFRNQLRPEAKVEDEQKWKDTHGL